ncbi:MAG: RNA methyltransferase [Candidatus Cloacimonetes bacterium]|nr:RNA methyltransferase [Candidatus Cloacimonadota bacterium]
MKFSKKKFTNLPEKRQVKKILDICQLIEKNWENSELRIDYLENLKNCLKWISDNKIEKFSNLREKLSNNLTQHNFLQLFIPYEQTYSSTLIDHKIIINKIDKKSKENSIIPVVVILDNLRSAFNVGAIFRTSECVGISEIVLCGYTSLPDQKKVQDSAMGTEKIVKWKHFPSTLKAIEHYKSKEYSIYALETTTNAKSIFETKYDKPLALILGNEALGISEDILKICDEIVEIPVFGMKNSLNVGVAFSICAYEVRRKISPQRR